VGAEFATRPFVCRDGAQACLRPVPIVAHRRFVAGIQRMTVAGG
jgi:hypothetical protein